MRRALGTLFAATLAVTMFVGPYAGTSASPQAPASLPSLQTKSESQPRQPNTTAPKSSASNCVVRSKDPCQNCAEFCPAKGLLDTIGAFFGPPQKKDTEAAKHWGVPSDARANMRFVIATVADPVHTHLAFFFDRQIDAIQEAVQQDGYLFARSYMPWDYKDHPENSDFRIRLAQDDYLNDRQSYPGLMIFRDANTSVEPEQRRHLFVFAVGETPTGGINKSQFRNAIEAIQAICGSDGCLPPAKPSDPSHTVPPDRSLFLLAPTFSGSFYSLAFLLRDEVRGKFKNIYVDSGTATDYDSICWFKRFAKSPKQVGDLQIRFRAFQESSDYALAHFLGLICHYGYRGQDVAVLSEDQTAYGNAYAVDKGSDTDKEKNSSGSCSSSDPSTCRKYVTVPNNHCIDPSQVLHLYFPRDIAQLRAAYQQSLSAQGSGPDSAKSAPRSTLQLNLADTGNDDSVPHYSVAQTPLSQEAVMLGIVSNLQKHHVRFVVLQATNPLDLLFLMRFLRAGYSEGRIVTIDTDMLFPREVDDANFQGIFQISSYPLIPGIDDEVAVPEKYDPGVHIDRVFPSNDAAGAFNALLSLLRFQQVEDPSYCESACPSPAPSQSSCTQAPLPVVTSPPACSDLPRAAYAQYGWPALAGPPPPERRPLVAPLWLTVLGHGGYWPVALLDEKFTTDPSVGPPSDLHAIRGAADLKCYIPHIPIPWQILCALCLVILGRFAYLLWAGSILSYSEPVANFAPVNVRDRNWAVLVLDLIIFAIFLFLLWPWIHWRVGPPILSFEIPVVLLSLFWIVFALGNLWRRHASVEAIAFLFIAASAYFVTLWVSWFAVDSHESFYIYRYIHVSSGVSPLVPWLLLAAAGLWWVWYTLAGSALLDARMPRPPNAHDLNLSDDEAKALKKSTHFFRHLDRDHCSGLIAVMSPLNRDWRIYGPAILLTIIPVATMDLVHPVMSLERQIYDFLYALALGALAFVVMLGLIRVTVIWLDFRPLLVALDRLPLRRTFRRLHGYTWGPLWRLGGTALQDSYRLVSRQFEVLDHLANLDHRLPTLATQIRLARETRTEVEDNLEAYRAAPGGRSPGLFIAEPRWVADWTLEFRGVQERLASTAAATLKYLLFKWNEETRPDPYENGVVSDKTQDPPKPTESLEVQLAEEFVCLFYLNFILCVVLRMRTLVMCAIGIYVLSLLSFSSYPFEPKHTFDALMILLFLFLVAAVAFILAQMHRDPTLSLITDTKPGELDIQFWIRLGSILAIPTLSLIGAQFPGIGSFLFSWLQPALQALK